MITDIYRGAEVSRYDLTADYLHEVNCVSVTGYRETMFGVLKPGDELAFWHFQFPRHKVNVFFEWVLVRCWK